MLRKIDHNLWVAEQPLTYFGLSVGTRMSVIRLTNGELAVISPIQIDNTQIQHLNEIGQVSCIIAPNLYHYLFVSDFKALYPQAQLWAVPGLEAKRPELTVDRTIKGAEGQLFGEIKYCLFEGFNTLLLNGAVPLNEYAFFHPSSHTLILTDTAFYFDETFPFITQLASRILGGYKKLSPSLLEKIAIRDREKVKRSVEKILAWDFKRVIVAHGSILENDAKRKLREGYESFLNTSLSGKNEY